LKEENSEDSKVSVIKSTTPAGKAEL